MTAFENGQATGYNARHEERITEQSTAERYAKKCAAEVYRSEQARKKFIAGFLAGWNYKPE